MQTECAKPSGTFIKHLGIQRKLYGLVHDTRRKLGGYRSIICICSYALGIEVIVGKIGTTCLLRLVSGKMGQITWILHDINPMSLGL